MRRKIMTAAEARAIRLGFGLSQTKFAQLLGTAQETWSRIENDQYRINERTQRLLEAFVAHPEFYEKVKRDNGL